MENFIYLITFILIIYLIFEAIKKYISKKNKKRKNYYNNFYNNFSSDDTCVMVEENVCQDSDNEEYEEKEDNDNDDYSEYDDDEEEIIREKDNSIIINTGYNNLTNETESTLYDEADEYHCREEFSYYFKVLNLFSNTVNINSIEFKCTYISVLTFADDYNDIVYDYLDDFSGFFKMGYLKDTTLLRIDTKQVLSLIYNLSTASDCIVKEEYNKILEFFNRVKDEISESEFENDDDEFDRKTHYVILLSDVIKLFFDKRTNEFGACAISEIDKMAYDLKQNLKE